MQDISPEEACRRMQEGEIRLIDVRTPAEFRAAHAAGAENFELGRLQPSDFKDERKALAVICKSGMRAAQAARDLEDGGIEGICVVAGGTDAWLSAGLLAETGRPVISLERQVRITAGALVFTGTLLGVFIHAGFLLVPALVGAGLVFAGLTDTCGMALVLTRMPWNR